MIVGSVSAFAVVKTEGFTTFNFAKKTAMVKATNLNVRSSASETTSNIITTIPKGTIVTILNTENPSWYYVQLSNGTKGYVYSSYLS